MKSSTRTVLFVVGAIILLGGICLGVFIRDFPVLEFDKQISPIEVLTFLTTVAIGVIFPFLIKKWVDDNQTIKNYLVDEIEVLIDTISENKKVIEKSYQNQEFTQDDRDKINFTFHRTELQISSLEKQFSVSFPKASQLMDELKRSFREYKDDLTGGELMISTFNSVDLTFQRRHSNQYASFESALKEMIHKVHRL